LFADELYNYYQPYYFNDQVKVKLFEENWSSDPNLHIYEAIYEFHIELLRFSTVFSVRQDLLFKIGQNIYNLFFFLPEKSYGFILRFKPEECRDNLCIHTNETIRNIYKFLINKSMFVFNNYYSISLDSEEPGLVCLIKILDCLFSYLEDERLFKFI
jgi:hypothetical protein